MGSNSWAEKVAKAQEHGGGNYIDRHGRYRWAITEVIDKTDKNAGFKGEALVVKLRCITSEPLTKDQKDPPHGEGDARSVVFNFTTDKMALGKCKAFLNRVFDKKDNEIPEAAYVVLAKKITEPTQPLMGVLIDCETQEFTIKNGPRAGQKGVGTSWRHVAQTTEDVKAMRDWLMGAGMPAGQDTGESSGEQVEEPVAESA